MTSAAPYHTALAQGRLEDAAPLHGRHEADGCVVLRWDVTDGPPPADYQSCDLIYAEPAWPHGLPAFNARAGAEGLAFPTYAKAIGHAIQVLGKPTAIVGSLQALRHAPPPDMTTEVLLNGGKATLAFWNGAYAGGATTLEVLERLAQTYKRVGDFCAGYGMTGRVFRRAGGSFVLSDYNAQCCGYIAAHMEGWGA